MTDDLAAFIAARLDEDEAAAMSAAADVNRFAGRGNWSNLGPIVIDREDPDWAICDLAPFVDDECLARHIARHDPARVLREVAAKRAILARYLYCVEHDAPGNQDPSEYELEILPELAAGWSDHPDYRAEWKP